MKTFASLFTGGGLADIGAVMAGYELLWGVELDPAIAAVANANLAHCDRVYADSVVGFDWSRVEKPDHLHISPPCQDFSIAKSSGKPSNANDELAAACIDAIKALEPSSITLENVEGYRKASGFQRIVDHLWGAGYWVNVDVLNSADFGVPQTRRRLILRAVRGAFPLPLAAATERAGWFNAIADLIPALPSAEFAPWQLKTDRVNELQQHGKSYLVDGLPNNRGKSVTVVDGSRPAFTIKASVAKHVIRAVVSGKVIRLSPQCLARFQSVPDWYALPDSVKLACRIVGNGVPCKMMAGILA